jgi:hypothetical protein
MLPEYGTSFYGIQIFHTVNCASVHFTGSGSSTQSVLGEYGAVHTVHHFTGSGSSKFIPTHGSGRPKIKFQLNFTSGAIKTNIV